MPKIYLRKYYQPYELNHETSDTTIYAPDWLQECLNEFSKQIGLPGKPLKLTICHDRGASPIEVVETLPAKEQLKKQSYVVVKKKGAPTLLYYVNDKGVAEAIKITDKNWEKSVQTLFSHDQKSQKFKDSLRSLVTQYDAKAADAIERVESIVIKEPLTLRHLQMLARNEAANTTGIIDFASYEGRLTYEQILTLKDLVRQTIIVGKSIAVASGGYLCAKEINDPPQLVYLIDLPGFQFQKPDNSGRLLVIPEPGFFGRKRIPEGVLDNRIFTSIVGESKASYADCDKDELRYVSGTFHKVKAYLDIKAYQKFVAQDVQLAVRSLIDCLKADNFDADTQQILFKFTKYGTGHFAQGLKPKGILDQYINHAVRLGFETLFADEALLPDIKKYIGHISLPFFNEDPLLVNLCKTHGLGCDFANLDALKQHVKGKKYIVATTNSSDPHAGTGCEMLENSSLDSQIALDQADHANKFSPVLNELKSKFLKVKPLVKAKEIKEDEELTEITLANLYLEHLPIEIRTKQLQALLDNKHIKTINFRGVPDLKHTMFWQFYEKAETIYLDWKQLRSLNEKEFFEVITSKKTKLPAFSEIHAEAMLAIIKLFLAKRTGTTAESMCSVLAERKVAAIKKFSAIIQLCETTKQKEPWTKIIEYLAMPYSVQNDLQKFSLALMDAQFLNDFPQLKQEYDHYKQKATQLFPLQEKNIAKIWQKTENAVHKNVEGLNQLLVRSLLERFDTVSVEQVKPASTITLDLQGLQLTVLEMKKINEKFGSKDLIGAVYLDWQQLLMLEESDFLAIVNNKKFKLPNLSPTEAVQLIPMLASYKNYNNPIIEVMQKIIKASLKEKDSSIAAEKKCAALVQVVVGNDKNPGAKVIAYVASYAANFTNKYERINSSIQNAQTLDECLQAKQQYLEFKSQVNKRFKTKENDELKIWQTIEDRVRQQLQKLNDDLVAAIIKISRKLSNDSQNNTNVFDIDFRGLNLSKENIVVINVCLGIDEKVKNILIDFSNFAELDAMEFFGTLQNTRYAENLKEVKDEVIIAAMSELLQIERRNTIAVQEILDVLQDPLINKKFVFIAIAYLCDVIDSFSFLPGTIKTFLKPREDAVIEQQRQLLQKIIDADSWSVLDDLKIKIKADREEKSSFFQSFVIFSKKATSNVKKNWYLKELSLLNDPKTVEFFDKQYQTLAKAIADAKSLKDLNQLEKNIHFFKTKVALLFKVDKDNFVTVLKKIDPRPDLSSFEKISKYPQELKNSIIEKIKKNNAVHSWDELNYVLKSVGDDIFNIRLVPKISYEPNKALETISAVVNKILNANATKNSQLFTDVIPNEIKDIKDILMLNLSEHLSLKKINEILSQPNDDKRTVVLKELVRAYFVTISHIDTHIENINTILSFCTKFEKEIDLRGLMSLKLCLQQFTKLKVEDEEIIYRHSALIPFIEALKNLDQNTPGIADIIKLAETVKDNIAKELLPVDKEEKPTETRDLGL